MRIFHITPHYLPSFAGITTVIREISAEEHACGHDVSALCYFPWKPWQETNVKSEIIENVNVFRVKNRMMVCKNEIIGRLLNRFLLPFDIIRVLSGKKIDCLHIAGVHHLTYGSLLWAKIKRIPVLLSLYGEELRVFESYGVNQSFFKSVKTVFRYFIYWIIFKSVDDVSCSSRSLAVRLEELGLYKNSRLIFNGVNVSKISIPDNDTVNRLKSKYSIPEPDFIIGSVGGISPRKGYDILIDVFATACKKEAGLRLAIVGGGDIESLRGFAVSKGVLDKVIFLGALSYEQLLEVYPLFDMYVQLPRQEEGVSQTALEAAMFNKPVVLSDCGAMRDSVNDGVSGFIFPIEKIDKIADKILELYNNLDLMYKLGCEGRKWVRENFSYAKIAGQYMDVYKNLADKIKG